MNNKSIVVSGKIQSGKDTIGNIIQYLTSECYQNKDKHIFRTYEQFCSAPDNNDNNVFNSKYQSPYEVKKFAGKLKQIVSILTGYSLSDLEQEFVKNQTLPSEWDRLFATSMNGNKLSPYFTNAIDVKNWMKSLPWYKRLYYFNYKIKREPITIRLLLQEVGTDAMRNIIHPNVWVNALLSEYQASVEYDDTTTDGNIWTYPLWIITDCRFKNELAATTKLGFISIRVNRKTSKQSNHQSEIDLDKSSFDWEINNDGTLEDLFDTIKQILITEGIIKN